MTYVPPTPPPESESWFNSLRDGKCTSKVNKKLGQQLTQTDGDLPINRRKNRYYNILPYDSNRVALNRFLDPTKPEATANDYINASYIQVPNCTQRYIATQAPLPSTIADFWKMALDSRSPLIVVLTKQFEGPTRKYHLYWPTSSYQPLIFESDQIQVELISEIEHPLSKHIFIAKFRVTGSKLGEGVTTHHVTQIRFEEWPDFGVPSHPSQLLTLLDIYQLEMAIQQEKAQGQTLGPPIIHCSAGVGRTGTFCAVDSALTILSTWQPAQSDLIVHIVNAFRQQRAYMVQSSAQFKFVYQVLHYYLQTRPDH